MKEQKNQKINIVKKAPANINLGAMSTTYSITLPNGVIVTTPSEFTRLV